MLFPKNNNGILVFIFCLFQASITLGQEIEQESRRFKQRKVLMDDIEQLLETIVEQFDETFDFDTFLEYLMDLTDRPINLNNASYDELLDFQLLSAKQVDEIIQHREKFGKFISIHELQAVNGLSLEDIRIMLPFVMVKGDLDRYQVNSVKELLFDGDYQLFIRYTQVLDEQRGYTDLEEGQTGSRYLGNPSKIYARFRYNFAQKLSYGFTVEKDAGEEVFGSSQPRGFDFYSGHIFIRDVGIFKSIAVGDYEVKLGQGLIMWSGFGFGKSPMVTNVKKESDQLKAYTSVDENRFMRGLATTISAGKNVEITTFLSRDRKDANITVNEDAESDLIAEVSSLQESGLHRTLSEVSNKDALNITIAGGNIKYSRRISHIGITATHTRLDADIRRRSQLYNQFEFSGNSVTNFGFDYSLLIKNFYFFGEYAMSGNMAIATVNGFLASLDPKADLAVVHRYYQKDYHALFANPFAESRNPYNEHGIYAGLSLKPIEKLRFDNYIDYYKFPWLRYQVDAPSSGLDFLSQLTFRPSRTMEMYFRYKNEVKDGNLPGNETRIDVLTGKKRQNIRFHISYKVSGSFTFKNRFEYVIYEDPEKEKGYLIYQDIIYQPLSSPFSFSARFALFDTKTYDTRVYAFESDVLYAFSIPPYYNKGTRFYFMIRYRIVRGIDIWLRFAQTYFANQQTFGSGLEQIDGNVRSEIKAMVRFKF